MASLLFPDDERSVQPLLIPPPPDERGPLAPDPRADALAQATGQVYQQVSDYIAKQQRDAIDRGLWEGGQVWEGGHPTRGGLLDAARQTAEGVAMGTTSSGGKPSFTTYQGSPHKFAPTPKNPLGEFSNERIGTGTGGQSEGMGHYTAENEAIAKHYRDLLSQRRNSPEQVALATDLETSAGLQMPTSSGIATATNPRQEAADFAAVLERTPSHWPDRAERLEQAARLRAHLPNIPETAVPPPGPGHMYEVKINADPEHYLSWDTPLNRQSDFVIDAFRRALPPDKVIHPRLLDMTGKEIYKVLERKIGKEQASRVLQDKYGIPGIRYLDAGSRGEGGGTHNYVTFDPAIMEIIRRYGLAGLMLGGGGLLAPNRQER